MVKDHSTVNAQLTAIAKGNIRLLKCQSNKSQKELQKWSGKSGTDFDKVYTDLMVSGHKENINEFNKEAEKGKISN